MLAGGALALLDREAQAGMTVRVLVDRDRLPSLPNVPADAYSFFISSRVIAVFSRSPDHSDPGFVFLTGSCQSHSFFPLSPVTHSSTPMLSWHH